MDEIGLDNSSPPVPVVSGADAVPGFPVGSRIDETVTIEPLPQGSNPFGLTQPLPQESAPTAAVQEGQQLTPNQINTTDIVFQSVPVSTPAAVGSGSQNTAIQQPPRPSKQDKASLRGLFKLLIMLVVPLGAIAATVTIYLSSVKESSYRREKEVLVAVPMKNVNWQDLGNVFEPVITLPVKTQTSWEDWEFLIDSGAVISSLPNEWATKTGQDIAFMKRSTFRGFGGKTSLAYQGEMEIRVGTESIKLPVVFTESSGTKSLLGRKGFFENYSLYFNHKERQIEIRK